MRRLILFIPLVVFMALGVLFYKGLQLDPSELESALLDKPFPAFSTPSLNDENQLVTEQDLKGKPALVNVWATWCPTCKQEHAQLNRIAREGGVIIYGINYKDDRSAAKEWLRRYSDPYVLNIFDEDGALGVNLGVYGAPETYVIDANGVIRYKHVGAVDEKVWQALKGVLAEVSL